MFECRNLSKTNPVWVNIGSFDVTIFIYKLFSGNVIKHILNSSTQCNKLLLRIYLTEEHADVNRILKLKI